MSWAAGTGLISGRGGGILAPGSFATRAEVAQILMNFCICVGDQGQKKIELYSCFTSYYASHMNFSWFQSPSLLRI